MNTALYNLIVYFCLLVRGTPRLDKKQNDIHDKLRVIAFITLFALAILGLLAFCFWIKPPEIWSMDLA